MTIDSRTCTVFILVSTVLYLYRSFHTGGRCEIWPRNFRKKLIEKHFHVKVRSTVRYISPQKKQESPQRTSEVERGTWQTRRSAFPWHSRCTHIRHHIPVLSMARSSGSWHVATRERRGRADATRQNVITLVLLSYLLRSQKIRSIDKHPPNRLKNRKPPQRPTHTKKARRAKEKSQRSTTERARSV